MCPHCGASVESLDYYGLAVCRECKDYFTTGDYENMDKVES